jgi:MFS family permease
MNMGLVVFWVGLPYLAQDWFHAGPGQLGLMGGSAAAGYVLTCLFAGRISGLLRRRYAIALGALVISLVSLTAGFAWSVWFLVAIVAVNGFGHGLFWPALEAHLSARVGPTELRHRMGWFNLSWSSGDAAGAVVGGGLYTLAKALVVPTGLTGVQILPFLVTTGFGVATCVVALKVLHAAPESNSWRDRHDAGVPRSPGRGGPAFLGVFWIMALIANSAATAFRGILINVFPDMGKGLLHYSALRWGVLLAMVPITRTLMFLYWQRHWGWTYRARYLLGFQILLPLAAIVIIFNSSYVVFLITFAVIGVGMSQTYFSSIYYGMDSDHSHEKRGGIHEAALGSGNAVGTPLAGWFASASGWVRAPYLFAFLFLTAAMILQVFLYLTRKRASNL